MNAAWEVVEVVQEAVSLLRAQRELQSGPSALNTPRSSAGAVFVSWAHRNPEWSKAEELSWQTQVAKFVFTLRQRGVDADIDLFYLEDPEVDWTRFGPTKVSEADVVLIVLSQAWADRWNGANDPKVGAGAVAEADELHGLFARDQAAWQRKCLIVMFPEVEPSVLPLGLARANRFSVDPYDLDSYEPLLRTLTSQPSFAKPALGVVPVLPPRVESGPTLVGADEWVRVSKAERRAHSRERAIGVTPAQEEALINREAMVQGLVDALREEDPEG